jgi:hypothetical protein
VLKSGKRTVMGDGRLPVRLSTYSSASTTAWMIEKDLLLSPVVAAVSVTGRSPGCTSECTWESM